MNVEAYPLMSVYYKFPTIQTLVDYKLWVTTADKKNSHTKAELWEGFCSGRVWPLKILFFLLCYLVRNVSYLANYF